ncbi:MAG: amidohydrolase family protein [Desulfobacterales bacterium]
MIIDFHTHVVQPDVRHNRGDYFSDEPEFKLLYESPGAKLAGAEDTIAAMDEAGVDRSVIFGFPWRNPETVRQNNDYVLSAVQRYPDRLIGFCCVNPARRDAADEVNRCLRAGCAGVGELAFYGGGIDAAALEMLAPVMEACRSHNVIALIHTNEPIGHMYPGKVPMTLGQIYAMVKRFKENKIVLAHWGGGLFLYSLLKREVRKNLKHVWFDTAASPFLYEPKIYHIAKKTIGLEKVLFGTDYPLLKPIRYFNEMRDAGLTEQEISAVCGDNAAALLNGNRPFFYSEKASSD